MNKIIISLIIVASIVANAWAINPPGTKKVKIDKEVIYIDQSEIIIADWMEYINYLEHRYGKDSEELKSAFPNGITTKDMMAKEKLTHPLTGITHEQAVDYCKWRTAAVNAVNEETGLGKVEYTLPTEEQYRMLIKTFGNYEILSDKNRTERITGLQSSVYELTAEGSVMKNNGIFSKEEQLPSANIGFRCVATMVKQKK
ncbi:MAG: SUMF1/EgtB/PvdO family nonheme iron enzyme [Bacteroidales bacterium]|nr:SUMF1/EgtB/PvdO family nonheme iron enzyme [Bacteroidales bacterium]